MVQDFLPPDFVEKLEGVDSADLLIGIPTYNNAATIEHVVNAVARGATKTFPSSRVILLNCDGGSSDGTAELCQRAAGDYLEVVTIPHSVAGVGPLVSPDHGIPGYENALRTVLYLANHCRVRGCALINGNFRSVPPEWISLLLTPITGRSFDLVAPLFRRHKYDGSLTNSILYPVNRAMYGKQVRFQSGGAYGFSHPLIKRLLDKDGWAQHEVQYGVEQWLTTVAVAEGFEVCHAALGIKDQDTKSSGGDLAAVLSQAVGGLFSLMEEYHLDWEGRKGSSPIPMFGPACELGVELVPVNVGKMVKAFRQGLRDLLPLWEIILSGDTMPQVLPLGLMDLDEFRFPNDVWVSVVYDFAVAYHEKLVHREHLLKALTPLYLGRTAAYLLEVKDHGPEGVEHVIEELCGEFETQKFSLVERWR